ncbi:hypothetical protein SPLC1_S500290 [Arthrospira platensis C1]|nr:hypothetical protein SPLC1_S500290 [Arthrospira platensis C1]
MIELAIAGNGEAIVTQNVKEFQQRELIFPQLSIISPEALIRESVQYGNFNDSFTR